jgi:Tol biopolymer transport system component
VVGDTNGKSDIFVHDLELEQTIRISVDNDGTEGDGDSWLPAISSDGSVVAFVSSATNLVNGDTMGYRDVFAHERMSEVTTRISVASDGTEANNHSGYPAISADGLLIAFESTATNLVGGDANGVGDIFLHDRLNGETSLASVSSEGGQGDFGAFFPSISADGRYVAFFSWATNLVPDDINSYSDVFIRDRQKGKIVLVSLSSAGMQGNENSGYSSISGDGRYTAFQSSATNLVDGDTNGARDIFVRDQGEEWFAYSITGTVSEQSGAPLSGVLISCDCDASGITGMDGSYLISDVLSGTYTLTATMDGYIFSPGWQVVSVPPDAAGVNFTATMENLLTNLPIVIK